MKLNLNLLPHTKSGLQKINKPKVRGKLMKLIGDNVGENLLGSENAWEQTFKGMNHKAKQMDHV